MSNIDMYCVTNKKISFLEETPYYLGAVGKENFSDRYISSNTLDNIFYKEKNYSELTFHYWIWKNKLNVCKNQWIGFCQKRRFWIKPNSKGINVNKKNFKEHLLTELNQEYNNFETIICEPTNLFDVKKIKLIKRGWKNLIKNPSIFFDKNKHTIALHFDMHHGYKNLEIASDLLNLEDRNEFKEYVNSKNYFNPHIMFISKPYVAKKWFDTLFPWLEICEKKFGFNKLGGYDTTRLYAYLAERYLSFWFKKYTKYKEFPYLTMDI